MQIYMHMRKQTQPLLSIPPGDLTMDVSGHRWPKGKVVVVMGATGTGKSRLSIDLATRFPAEIVNSDKMQVYEGLDIVTNKITEEEQRGVPHHLLRIAHPNCCFLWVDVSRSVLHSFVSKRVDKMVEKGMVEEVQQLFHPNADYTRGIRRAIGVPELDLYFRTEGFLDEEARARVLQEAVHEIKANTCKLACRQLEKIHRLKNVRKWKIHRLGATEVLRKCDREADEAWEKLVARPSTMMVAQFLYSVGATRSIATTSPPTIRAAASMEAALAATH
ncbi:unnamed protein product, partial [Vitis vinifera]